MAIQSQSAVLRTYAGRLALYVIPTVLFSMLGSALTWRASSPWADANPLVAGPIATLSLLPAIAILAAIDVRWRGAVIVAVGACFAIVVLWWIFATSDSSTAALVFYWGWLAGIPLALGVKLLERRVRSHRRRPPTSRDRSV